MTDFRDTSSGQGSNLGPSSLSGMKGLIVEDNMIIAMDAEQLMLDHGMESVAMAGNISDARKLIERDAFDIALLDVNLGSETSFALVPPLNEKSVPFVFATGYGEKVELPEDASHASAIRKPFTAEELVHAILKAVDRPGA